MMLYSHETTVIVLPASCNTPAAPIASNNSPVCSGNTINLKATTVPGATYSWTGPDFSSTEQNPSIVNATATNAGEYKVKVIVDNCSSAEAVTIVGINSTINSPSASNNGPLCPGSNLYFSASAENINF